MDCPVFGFAGLEYIDSVITVIPDAIGSFAIASGVDSFAPVLILA